MPHELSFEHSRFGSKADFSQRATDVALPLKADIAGPKKEGTGTMTGPPVALAVEALRANWPCSIEASARDPLAAVLHQLFRVGAADRSQCRQAAVSYRRQYIA